MGLARMVHGIRPRRWGHGRTPRHETTAFVLGGGGVLGAVQVGHLQALLEAGIVPDLLVGASVGALNAAAIAADPTLEGAAQLREVWASLRTEDLFPGNRIQRAWQFLRRGDHLYPNDGIRRIIDKVPAPTFEHLRIPVSVAATNLRTGKEHWFETGPLPPALLASSALPGIFPPVAHDGELYVDGGVVNNVPIARAVALGASKIYVLTCGGPRHEEKPIRGPLDVLLRAVSHSRAARVEVEVEQYSARASIELLPTFDTGDIRFNDPTQSVRLMDRSLEMTRAYLAKPVAPVHAHA